MPPKRTNGASLEQSILDVIFNIFTLAALFLKKLVGYGVLNNNDAGSLLFDSDHCKA